MPARRLGKRRRRLRFTLGLLAVAAVLAVALGVWAYHASRPEMRRPGEALPEITEKLARGIPDEAPSPELTDVTAAAGLAGFRTFTGERTSQLPEDMGSGAAWGDFDGDGDDDLFLVAAGGPLGSPPETWAPSQLYENRGDGTFAPASGFPQTRIQGMGAAWGDADGDGDLDLAVSGYRYLRLFENDGHGRFTSTAAFEAFAGGYWAGLAWADFDADGDLDLYVCGYVDYEEPAGGEREVTEQYGASVPYTLNPASFEPASNLLLENRGGAFENVALPWGVSNPGGRSLSALWHDFDDDGRLDLYVANDISDNALFLHRGETFEDASLAAWVADYRGAMGLAAGDWNRDGDDDLFVTHWLAQENALYDSRLRAEPPSPESGMWGGGGTASTLTFTDQSAPLGLGQIALPLVGWGTELADLDADGWLDVVVANGSTLEDRTNPGRLEPQRSFLMWSRLGRSFHDLAPMAAPLSTPRVSRGLALSDYDGDGDLDLLLVHLDAGVQLLRNDMAQGRRLQLDLRHRLPSGTWGLAEGATAVAWVGGVPLRRSLTGASYLSQSTRVLHFGLGDAEQVDRLEVRWPSGTIERFGPLAANTRWRIREGDGPARPLAGDGEQAGARPLSRDETVAFWEVQRQAMDAIKRDGDLEAAVTLLERALELDPGHEDSRYYLANCLWALGRRDEALAQLDELRRRSPGSHRAQRQWAVLKARTAGDDAGYEAAEQAAEQALAINREETGALLLLGEIALLRGNPEEAGRRLEMACRTNPRAVGGFFLRAYVAWRAGDTGRARELLRQAHEARGPEWKPEGSVAEGDVARRMHQDETPLSRFWQTWDGRDDPAALAPLHEHLAGG